MVCLPAGPRIDPSPAGSVSVLDKLSKRRGYVTPVARLLSRDPTTQDVGRRMTRCAEALALAIELPDGAPARALIESGRFCQARLCPFCEWRRTKAWRRRLILGLSGFAAEHPTHKAVMLTLTVRNCPIAATSDTLNDIHAGFKRLAQCAFFPTAYWLRRTEVTVGKPSYADELPRGSHFGFQGRRLELRQSLNPASGGEAVFEQPVVGGLWAHPHIHALLLVPASYFSHNYITQSEWQRQWQMACRLDYAPVIDIRKAYTKTASEDLIDTIPPAVIEAGKYVTKSADIHALGQQAPELHCQLKNKRMLGVSKALRKYVTDAEVLESELTDQAEVLASNSAMAHVVAQWDSEVSEYRITP